MRTARIGSRAAVLALALICSSAATAQDRPGLLQVSGGIFDVGLSVTAAEVGVELTRPLRWWRLDLAGGVSGTEEGSVWAHLGVRRDLAPGDRLGVTPGFAVALYEQGDGKNLGGAIQFRSSLAVDFRVTARTRAGVTVYHLSNAGLEKPNPGANGAVLTFGVALD